MSCITGVEKLEASQCNQKLFTATNMQIHQVIKAKDSSWKVLMVESIAHLYMPNAYKVLENQYALNRELFKKCCH